MHLALLGLPAPDPLAGLLDEPLSERLQGGPIGGDLGGGEGCILFDIGLGLPVRCRICGRCDRWLPEGLAWICEHEPSPHVPWLRVIDSVRADKVTPGRRASF